MQGDSEDTVSIPDSSIPSSTVESSFRLEWTMVDVGAIFRQRAAVMKSVPRFLHGPFTNSTESCHGGGIQFRSVETGDGDGKYSCCCPGCFYTVLQAEAHFSGQVDFKIRGFPTQRVAQFVGSQRAVQCQGCPSAVSSQETTSG